MMSDYVNDHLKSETPYMGIRTPLEYVDGTIISIQASIRHYSTKSKNNDSKYSHVEVMFMNSDYWRYRSLKPYWLGGAFARVPIEALNRIIYRKGGKKRN